MLSNKALGTELGIEKGFTAPFQDYGTGLVTSYLLNYSYVFHLVIFSVNYCYFVRIFKVYISFLLKEMVFSVVVLETMVLVSRLLEDIN